MNFPIVLHKDPGSDYGVTVPDLPGCFSAGSTIEEALAMAREAIELYVETLVEDGREIPDASPIEQLLRDNPHYSDGIWAIVPAEYRRRKDPASAATAAG